MSTSVPTVSSVLETDPSLFATAQTHARGPEGQLPITPEMLLTAPSGNLFGLTQNAGMGWEPQRLLDPEFLILSTHGGLRAADGTPIALGFHTGHWEVGLLVAEAARELRNLHAIPFAGAVTDPCDGRTQGTAGMLDSLPFRNDAAMTLRRLIRSLPTRRGVLGIATCDKGLPAMMMALASSGSYPTVLVPGGVTLLPESEPGHPSEDAGKVQTIGARFAHERGELHERVAGDIADTEHRADRQDGTASADTHGDEPRGRCAVCRPEHARRVEDGHRRAAHDREPEHERRHPGQGLDRQGPHRLRDELHRDGARA